GGLPPVTPLFPPAPPPPAGPLADAPATIAPMPVVVIDTPELQQNARRNSEDFVRAFRQQPGLSAVFADKPLAVYDELTLRDAWGSPIVFMPTHHPQIGMAPAGHFFFSAGPDRLYLT